MTGPPSFPSKPHKVSPALDPRGWLAAIIESSDDAIVSKTLQGIVTTWNKAAERIFGYTADEIVGKPILTIIPADRQQEETMILGRIRKGERVDHFETIRQRKDGALIHVSVTISPVRNAEGKIVGVSKIARDITPWKHLQRELLAAKEAADQARRSAEEARELAESARAEAESANRAKDHFLSVLSHELRTPLTPALGAISYLEKDDSLPEAAREQISMVRRNVETQARLVDDLLDLTRIARGKMSLQFEVVDAQALVRSAVEMFQKQIDEKALAIQLVLRAKAHHVWADAGRFQQILLNLVSNAVKFTPEEGTITLRTANRAGDLEIKITDTGVGIEPEVMPRLFSAFEQGERTLARRFGGLGLGLSIVKSLMEMHKGTVAASAGKGKGATFTLTLPTTRPAEKSENSAAAGSADKLPKDCRILLVEDHADTRQVMDLLLRKLGADVTTAGSVKEASEVANRQSFDLLICDFGLPDGTGVDVMNQIHQTRKIKAIAITGFGQDEDLRRSKEAGFAVHLTKPVSIDTLHHAIREVVT